MWLPLSALHLLKWEIRHLNRQWDCLSGFQIQWHTRSTLHRFSQWSDLGGTDLTLLNVIDAIANKSELYPLMCYALGGSLCWRLGLLPRHCDYNEDRHGFLIPPLTPNTEKYLALSIFIHSKNKTDWVGNFFPHIPVKIFQCNFFF
jgi:hypothetical protein